MFLVGLPGPAGSLQCSLEAELDLLYDWYVFVLIIGGLICHSPAVDLVVRTVHVKSTVCDAVCQLIQCPMIFDCYI